ncbi:unnamed protein product [Dicrocoelium dendriticum]|nr:unnamed protein product [Dicrocoelium dendriticum]
MALVTHSDAHKIVAQQQMHRELLHAISEAHVRLQKVADKVRSALHLEETSGQLTKPQFVSENPSGAPGEHLLLQQSKMSAASAVFLHKAVECFSNVEQQLTEKRSEIRRLSADNDDLKACVAHLLEEISDAEGQLAAANEEAEYWELLCSLGQKDHDLELYQSDAETWNETLRYDTLWHSEYACSLSDHIQPMLINSENECASNIMQRVLSLPLNDVKDAPTHASLLELVARKFYENENFSSCAALLEKVIELRKSSYGSNHPIVAATMLCLAITRGAMKDFDMAPKLAHEALDLMERHTDAPKNRETVARQYAKVGQKLMLWGFHQEGIRLMQQALYMLEDLLPREEPYWCQLVYLMARMCNDNGYYDDALTASCYTVDYFHAEQHGLFAARIPTIVEVAYAHQTVKRPPVLLSRSLTNALKEAAISFAGRHEFKAAQILANYLNACSNASICDPNALYIPPLRHEQQSILKSVRPKIVRTNRPRDPDNKGVLRNLTGLFKTKR